MNETVTIRRDLLDSLVDSDPCWFDHHGGCQAHGYLSLEPGELCPQAEVKALLARPVTTPGVGADGAPTSNVHAVAVEAVADALRHLDHPNATAEEAASCAVWALLEQPAVLARLAGADRPTVKTEITQ